MKYVLFVGGALAVIAALMWLAQWLSDDGPSWGPPLALIVGIIITVLAALFLEAAQTVP